jgi:hypothetical protein
MAIGIPPPSSGFGARRVHRTIPSGSGSPDATPSVNGYVLKIGLAKRRRLTSAGDGAVVDGHDGGIIGVWGLDLTSFSSVSTVVARSNTTANPRRVTLV